MRRTALIACLLVLGAGGATALATPGDLTYLYGVPYGSGYSHLHAPRGVAEAADGSILIADTENHRVVRVARNGAAETVAGVIDQQGFSGDGGPATQARLRYPRGVAALPDGGFLIADSDNRRIRRVSAAGIIETVAGGGYNGDGCNARRAALWWPESVTAVPGGGFLIADSSRGQVRRVWPDGSITRVAGDPGGPHDRNGILAVDADIDATDTSLTEDGGFLVTDSVYNTVRKVAPNGTIVTVAGTGYQSTDVGGDGGPATSADVGRPHAVAATSGGGFLIAQELHHRIRAVSPGAVISTLAGGPERYGLHYPHDVALLSGGGGVVADTGSDRVMLMETALRPAVAPPTTYPGTGGYAGACLGLDPSFDGGAVRSAVLTNRAARGVVAQPDGKVVVAGELGGDQRYELALERYLANGELDRSFGDNGLAQLPAPHRSTGFALGEQPDGKLITVGGTGIDGVSVLVVARFTADGRLDRSFGDGGIALSRALDHADAVDFGPDGRIVIAGGKVWDPRLVRINREGTVDQSFGAAGFAPGPYGVTAVESMPDGRVVTASGPQLGYTGPSETITITRFNPDGSLDRSFAGSGRVNLVPVQSRFLDPTALAMQPDGRLLVAGQYDRDFGWESDFPAIVMRLMPDGSIDRSFGEAGIATIDPLHYRWTGGLYPIGAARVKSVAIHADGKIVMAGGDLVGGGFAIYRMLPNGTLDAGFGAGGRIITWLEGGTNANAVRLRPDGRIVAAGELLAGTVVAATYDPGRTSGSPVGHSGTTTPTGVPVRGTPAVPAPQPGASDVVKSGSAQAVAPARQAVMPARLSIAGWNRPRIGPLLRSAWKVSVEAPAAGSVLVRLTSRGRTLARRNARVRRSGRAAIRLRSTTRARRLVAGRRAIRATVLLLFRSKDSSAAVKRTVVFRR